MAKYDHKKIEAKWQEAWEKTKINQVDLDKAKKPFYNLMMFPYPSAEGLHVGNMYAFVHSDTYGRFIRHQGYDVFEPIGLDGFGIHSENYAIKIKEHIKDVSERTEKHFYEQLHMIGNMYDWNRTVETYKPNYYKWTQWLFLKMYEKGLSYRKKSFVNWCPSCKTVLSDEQVISDRCERCDSLVEKKEMEQWFFKITDYAEKLLSNLDWLDWSEDVKLIQKNWIGKSEGANVRFPIVPQTVAEKDADGSRKNFSDTRGPRVKPEDDGYIEVFTTRPDTLFGATFMVLAPEHPFVAELLKQKTIRKQQLTEIEGYIKKTQKMSEQDRENATKSKTGVFTGSYAINPVNNEQIPIWIADYVMMGYGHGAIMAVPAHDQRDYDFAKKYKLPVKEVVQPKFVGKTGDGAFREGQPIVDRDAVCAIVRNPKNNKYLCISWKDFHMHGLLTGGIDDGEDVVEAARREVAEEAGYVNLKHIPVKEHRINTFFYHRQKKVNRWARFRFVFFDLVNEKKKSVSEEESAKLDIIWLTRTEMQNFFTVYEGEYLLEIIDDPDKIYTGDGILVNSQEFDGLDSGEAKEAIISKLSKKKLAKKATNYKIRDWCVSRQRYWGPPIPMIECEKCGWTPVPEKDLPVLLPEMNDFLPDGSGKGPLNKIKEFVNTKCPKCGGPAKRETDVSDPFVDSSWYFLRYPSTENQEKALDKKRLQKWLPVDMYIGGKEHSVLHLLYSRFVNMVMHEYGYVPKEEPYKKFRAHGLLIKEGAKISKSKGNIVNPDSYIEKFGADAVRMYLMFLGEMRLGGDWRDSGMAGMHKFVKRVWDVFDCKKITYDSPDAETNKIMNKAIKKVTEELENLRYNTSISQLMIALNHLQKLPEVPEETAKQFILLLSPFAPFISEELWEKIGNKQSVHGAPWPKYDPKQLEEATVIVVVQVNGKVRANIEMSKDSTQKDVEKEALANENVKKFLEGKTPKKIIYVPEKILNIVV